jgi:TolB-like protein/class 3 adenylate cyclase/Tfp pilus assembly protein PilF
MERKLAAILAADVVGYSRLMEQDEATTFERLRGHRRELFQPEIARYNGRIFKLMGDGLMAEFGSVVDAVECAVALQRGMAERNAGAPEGQRIDVRIGVNLGDVIIEDQDRHGDGINIAARLQALAEPGGICVSRTVYNHVKSKLAPAFEPMGEHRVKNLAEPLAVYRIRTDATPAGPAGLIGPASTTPQRSRVYFVATALLLAAAAVLWHVWPSALPPRDRAAVAVLPLESMGADPMTVRLADGLTEDIITDLARFQDLDVIARNSVLPYRGKPVDIRQVARELNVAYVLEGSIQRRGDQIRVTAQLIDAGTTAQLWSERWDRPIADSFAVQTELAEQVAGRLGSVNGTDAITAAEIRKAKRRAPASLTAYDYYRVAVEAKGRFTRESIFSGIDLATKAIALDPDFGRAYAVRARLRYNTTHYGADFETAMQAMEADARRAVDLDPNDPEARGALAWYLTIRGRFAESEAELRAALQANPANVSVLIFAAAGLAADGHPEEGAALADKVLRLDPRASSGTLNTIKDAYFFSRRFNDAVAVISRIPEKARSRGSRLLLTLSYALLGLREEAARARSELQAVYPSISAELLLNQDWAFARPQEEKLFVDGFRVARVNLCASDADLAKVPHPKRLPDCLTQVPIR